MQVVVSAMDGDMVVTNKAAADSAVRSLQRHPDFLIFATMNPNAGEWRNNVLAPAWCCSCVDTRHAHLHKLKLEPFQTAVL